MYDVIEWGCCVSCTSPGKSFVLGGRDVVCNPRNGLRRSWQCEGRIELCVSAALVRALELARLRPRHNVAPYGNKPHPARGLPRWWPRKASTTLLRTTTMNFFSSKKVELPKHNPVLAYALQIPALQKLVGKRVILASNSPRRREILQTFVRSSDMRWS